MSEFFNSIKECVPSACVLYSIEHAKDNGLPPPLLEKAIDLMSSEEIKNKSVEEAVPLFICKSQITSEQVMRVEHETRGQHASRILGDNSELVELLHRIFIMCTLNPKQL